MRRLKLVWQGDLESFCKAHCQELAASDDNAVGPRRETVPRNALLFKELDETNNWARLGSQLYFGWFALLLTINGVAIGWLFAPSRAMPSFAPFVFFMFIVLNLMGTLATIFVGKYLLECDRRMQEVIATLTEHDGTENPESRPRSPMPQQAVKILFGFTAVALIMLVLFWMILILTPGH